MRTISACFGLAVLLCSREALACAPAVPTGKRVAVIEEAAVIIWEPATKTEHFIRRATFRGEASDFGFLVPTPTVPQLAPAGDGTFDHLERKTSRQVVYKTEKEVDWTPLILFPWMILNKGEGVPATTAAPPVQVLSTQKVGGYEAAILDATDAAALREWLGYHGYAATPDLEAWLDAYIAQRWIISAFKIDKEQNDIARTQAVRMSFTTERPFFPYREPASQREGATDSRLLSIWFVGPERVKGTIGTDGEWPAELDWSDTIRDLEVGGVKVNPEFRLTRFADTSSPRPGTDDLFFSRADDQKTVVPEPYVYTQVETTHVPADVILAPVLIAFFFVRRARKRRARQAITAASRRP